MLEFVLMWEVILIKGRRGLRGREKRLEWSKFGYLELTAKHMLV